MRVGAIEDQLGGMRRWQFFGDVVLAGGAQQVGAGDDAVLLAKPLMIGIVDVQVGAALGHQGSQIGGVNFMESSVAWLASKELP